jgi:biopolymer transport protein ExbD
MTRLKTNNLTVLKAGAWCVTLLVVLTTLSALSRSSAQVMQKGISVELASTSNALPMPDADNEDALIVTVTDNGTVYLGVDSIAPDTLTEAVKSRLSKRMQQIYIKADARSPYAAVLKILDAASQAGAETQILLTAQSGPGLRTPVLPQGLEVRVGQPPASGSSPTVITAVGSGNRWPTLEINDARTPWTTLQSTLAQFLRNLDKRVVMIKADGALPFAQVVHLIDICHASGADAVWVTRAS